MLSAKLNLSDQNITKTALIPGSLDKSYNSLLFNAITCILDTQEISIVNKMAILLIFMVVR